MSSEEDEETRLKFYNIPAVTKHISTHGIPKTNGAFRDMVASGSTQKLDSGKGLALVTCLHLVYFANHPQQINIMDQSSGRTIASIARWWSRNRSGGTAKRAV
jgi:hypothetical protein